MAVATREALHRMIDTLPDDRLDRAQALLELLHDRGVDPVLRALETAPEDDEPLTSEDAVILDRRRESAARGATVSDDEVARAFGQ